MAQSQSVRIPVIYADRPGWEGVQGAFKSPVIDLGIGFDPNGNADDNKPFAPGTLLNARALIDTGADDFVVDLKLLKAANAPRSPAGTMQVKTVHGQTAVPLFRVHMMFPGTLFKAELDVAGMDINDGSRAYNAIFGYRFFETGVLTLNPRGESYFDFV